MQTADGDALKFGESCFLWKAYCKSHRVIMNSRDMQPSQTKVLLALFTWIPSMNGKWPSQRFKGLQKISDPAHFFLSTELFKRNGLRKLYYHSMAYSVLLHIYLLLLYAVFGRCCALYFKVPPLLDQGLSSSTFCKLPKCLAIASSL